MRLINADKIHPDVRTQRGALAISQGQLAYAETINAIVIPNNATNGDVMYKTFGICLDDFKKTWGGGELTDAWWNSLYQKGGKE